MHINAPSRQSLLRYLLNELDETEREQIDTLLMTDAEYAAQFQEVEYDLLDALAAGELTGSEKERAILALKPSERFSPARHPLRNNVPEAVAPSRMEPVLIVARKEEIVPSRFHSVRWLALAALLLIGIALGRLASHRAASTSANNTSVVATPTVVLPHPPVVEVEPGSPGPLPVPQSSPKPQAAPVMATLLLPGASRSANSLSLRIPHDASAVQIDWPAPPDAQKATRYQLQWLNDTGKLACTSAGTSRHGGEGSLIRFRCNVQNVATGTDFVRVSAVPADPDVPSLIEVTVSVEKL